MNARPDKVSRNVFDQFESICREFRSEWKANSRPQLWDWLGRVAAAAQQQLFRNLLEAELHYRRRKNERISSRDYLQRSPQYAPQIRQAYDEPTLGSMELAAAGNAEPTGLSQTHSYLTQATDRLEECELVRELGRGGIGVVNEARHLKQGNRIALKTLPIGGARQQAKADNQHRFRREFRSLAEINHPSLVGM